MALGTWFSSEKSTDNMNNLEALTIVRNCALVSAQMHTKQGQAALKVIDRKLQSLMRKKAWRDGNGATPIHMGLPTHTYPLPAADEPIAAALRKAEGQLQFWLEHAREGDMGECARQTMDVLKAVRAVLPMQCKAAPAEVLLNMLLGQSADHEKK